MFVQRLELELKRSFLSIIEMIRGNILSGVTLHNVIDLVSKIDNKFTYLQQELTPDKFALEIRSLYQTYCSGRNCLTKNNAMFSMTIADIIINYAQNKVHSKAITFKLATFFSEIASISTKKEPRNTFFHPCYSKDKNLKYQATIEQFLNDCLNKQPIIRLSQQVPATAPHSANSENNIDISENLSAVKKQLLRHIKTQLHLCWDTNQVNTLQRFYREHFPNYFNYIMNPLFLYGIDSDWESKFNQLFERKRQEIAIIQQAMQQLQPQLEIIHENFLHVHSMYSQRSSHIKLDITNKFFTAIFESVELILKKIFPKMHKQFNVVTANKVSDIFFKILKHNPNKSFFINKDFALFFHECAITIINIAKEKRLLSPCLITTTQVLSDMPKHSQEVEGSHIQHDSILEPSVFLTSWLESIEHRLQRDMPNRSSALNTSMTKVFLRCFKEYINTIKNITDLNKFEQKLRTLPSHPLKIQRSLFSMKYTDTPAWQKALKYIANRKFVLANGIDPDRFFEVV